MISDRLYDQGLIFSKSRDISVHYHVETSSKIHQFYPVVPGTHSCLLEWLEHTVDHSPENNAEVENTSSFQYMFPWCSA
jgi:hypothetical protein